MSHFGFEVKLDCITSSLKIKKKNEISFLTRTSPARAPRFSSSFQIMHNITSRPSNRELKWSCPPLDEGIIIQGTCWAIEHRLDTGLNCLYSTVETILLFSHNHNGRLQTLNYLLPPHTRLLKTTLSGIHFFLFLYSGWLCSDESWWVGWFYPHTHEERHSFCYIHWFVSRKYNTVAAGSTDREKHNRTVCWGCLRDCYHLSESLAELSLIQKTFQSTLSLSLSLSVCWIYI